MGFFDRFKRKESVHIPRAGEPDGDTSKEPQESEEALSGGEQAAQEQNTIELGVAEQHAEEQNTEELPIVDEVPHEDTESRETDAEEIEVVEEETAPVIAPSIEALAPPEPSGQPEGSVTREIKDYTQKAAVDHVIEKTLVLAILNQKGGVGKSTTAVNLSAALGELGKSVLLIDLDPQGNATSGLGIDKSAIEHDTYDVLISQEDIKQAIVPDVCKGLDVLPATINLAGAEVELVNEMARENRLKSAVETLRGHYDYIFIDCPPSLGLLTVNALVAADQLFIPIQCEFYALEGVTKLLESMKRVKSMLNPQLEIFGVLLTMFDSRTTLSRQVADEVRKYFGPLVFEEMIPRTVKLSEAPSYGQPITEYDPTGKGARSYQALAEEVINRG